MNFDNNGFTKLARVITEYKGVPISVTEETFGFAYTLEELALVLPINNDTQKIVTYPNVNPQAYWGIVQQVTTNYIYGDEGYLEGTITTGFKRARFKQESSQETIDLKIQLLDAEVGTQEYSDLLKQIEAYRFTLQLPINDRTDYTLSALRDYYTDIPPLPEGDPDAIEPRFYQQKTRTQRETVTAANPESTEELALPDITVTSTIFESDRRHISSTGKPERYTQRTNYQRLEGAEGIDAIARSSYAQVIGRPGTHTRIEQVVPNNNSGTSNWLLYKDFNFWVSTPNSGTNFKTIEQTLSYPDVDDPTRAKKAATTQYNILNSRSSQTLNLSMRWMPGIEEGDLISFRGVKYVIFAIADQRTFFRGGQNGTLTLTCGRYIDLNLSVSKLPKS
jgi:hypothetical protein